MRSSTRRLALPLCLLVLVACSDEDAPDAACPEARTARCAAPIEGGGGVGTTTSSAAGTGGGGGVATSSIEVTESYEADIGDGWIAAGQPTEERLTEVVNLGARVITLRAASEESFDEQALVEALGGTFIRYATTASDYDSVAFREAMYDLYDAEKAKGGNVYLHCASSNRVGASWALYNAERRGVPAEDALQLGFDAGLGSLESLVRGILGL